MRRIPDYRVPRQAGFTLVEMMVVLALVVILATVAVALMPRFGERQKVISGSDQLQSWLLGAKQRALADRRASGLRLFRESGGLVRKLQYVQQPDDYYGGTDTYVGTDPGGRTNLIQGYRLLTSPTPREVALDFWGGQGPSQREFWQVQPGDYLELQGGGPVYRINSVRNSSGSMVGDVLELNSNLPNLVSKVRQYRILRQARPLPGEPELLLPEDVAVELNTNGQFLNAVPTTNAFDILFSPSGAVIGWGTGTDKIILWVCDVTKDGKPFDGEPRLMVINVRTGFIAAHPAINDIRTTCNEQQINISPPGQPVPITVADARNIAPGRWLILDFGSPYAERVKVVQVSGGQVFLEEVRRRHDTGQPGALNPIRVVADPYEFTRDGKSSGM